MLAQALPNKSSKEIAIPPQVLTPSTHFRDFMRLDPPRFHGCEIEEDLIDFIDEAYQIVAVMGIPSKEKDKLVAYQLKVVVKILCEQWADERCKGEGPI